MFWLGKAPKENFLVYSTQIVFSIIRLVSGHVIMIAIDICGNSPVTGEWIMELRENVLHFMFFVIY